MCNNQQAIRYEGWRGAAWAQYSSGACPSGSTCQPSLAGQEVTTQNGVIPSPCATECPGSAQVIVFDSAQQGLANIKVFVGESLEGTTSSSGLLQVSLNGGSSCGQQQTITTKCSDDTFCGSRSVSIDFPNETEAVMFDCTLCKGGGDFFIEQQDVFITTDGSLSRVNATVHSLNMGANNNLTVRFQTIGKDGLIKNTTNKIISITPNSIASTTADFDFANLDFVTIYVDPDNKFPEQKTNNFIRRATVKRIKAYLDVNTGIPKANEAIREFLEAFAEPVAENNADVVLAVGRFSQNIANTIVDSDEFIRQHGWGFRDEKVFAKGKSLELPYTGIVGSYTPLLGTDRLVALGTDIEGTIAAVKKMAAAGSIYFNPRTLRINPIEPKPLIILDRHDLTAVGVFDILHNFENANSYMTNTNNFKNAIAKSLSGNTFDVAIRLVNTTQTVQGKNATLRIKNLNSEFSQSYKDQVVENPMPVVFSGGLFSDLFRWERASLLGLSKGLAKQMVEAGRDSWEIEITGGPLIERPSDPNYNYTDLVDSYWPASLAAVQYYTNRITTQYVGHSNGCRVALSSLERYQNTGKSNVAKVQNLQTGQYVTVNLQGSQSTPVVDTFVGVGCPGALEGTSKLIERVTANPNSPQQLQTHNPSILHPARFDVASRIDPILSPLFLGGQPISLNLWKLYNQLVLNTTDLQPGQDLSINKLYLIYGYGGINSFGGEQDDGFVPVADSVGIANNINFNNTGVLSAFQVRHDALPNSPAVKSKIEESL